MPKKPGCKGVAMVTSQGNWLVDKKPLLKLGFEVLTKLRFVELLSLKFSDAPSPAFTSGWQKKWIACTGLTVFRTDSAPISKTRTAALEAAQEADIPSQVIELESSQDGCLTGRPALGVFQYRRERAIAVYFGWVRQICFRP